MNDDVATRVNAERAQSWSVHSIGELHQLFKGDTYRATIPGAALDAVELLCAEANSAARMADRLVEPTSSPRKRPAIAPDLALLGGPSRGKYR